jgi:ribulose-5-phosphate 4-epimerase/fuculose-1-phosphate aldolase
MPALRFSYARLMTDELREQVALGCRILGLEDQGDFVWGHVSARDPEGRGIWMKASTYGFEEIGRDRVILVSWDGEVLEGTGRRHIEYPIHSELMLARDDVNCVVHTHAPWAVAFASTHQPLRPISHEATLFVPPEVARFTKTGDLIMTRELGADVAGAVGDRNAAFMLHHGIVTCGTDVVGGVMAAVLLERACRTNIRVLAGGGPKSWSSDEEALSKRGHCWPPALLQQAWDYLARRLGA